MRTQPRLLKLFATLIVTSATVIAFAQEPQKRSPEKLADNQSEGKIICYTLLYMTNVSVTDSNNRRIPDLTHQDFTIFEDGVEQQIAIWAHNDSPVNFSLALN